MIILEWNLTHDLDEILTYQAPNGDIYEAYPVLQLDAFYQRFGSLERLGYPVVITHSGSDYKRVQVG